jgi:hypothetical protein
MQKVGDRIYKEGEKRGEFYIYTSTTWKPAKRDYSLL